MSGAPVHTEPDTLLPPDDAAVAGPGSRTLFEPLVLALKENLPFTAVGVSYVVLGAGVLHAIGLGSRLRLQFFYLSLAVVWFAGSAFIFVRRSLRTRRVVVPSARAVVGAFWVLLLAPPVQSTFQSLKQVMPEIRPFTWDGTLSALDRSVHLGWYPWQLLSPLLAYPGLVRFIDAIYMTWFLALAGTVVWAAWMPDRALRARVLTSVLLVWIVAGTFGAYTLSSAGPCYYGFVVSGPNPYEPLMRRLESIHTTTPLLAIFNERGLWTLQAEKAWVPFGGISAMPSVHVAFSALLVPIMFRISSAAGGLALLYLVLIQIGSVLLAWHYGIDGYLGALLALLVWKATSGVESAVERAGLRAGRWRPSFASAAGSGLTACRRRVPSRWAETRKRPFPDVADQREARLEVPYQLGGSSVRTETLENGEDTNRNAGPS